MLISQAEQLPLRAAFFESASAVATVGLTVGITPGLHTFSKILLVLMMYLGRVGGLTLIFAAVSPKNNGNARYPEDRMTVG
jgi:trk system potassium uptake protein TrkH